jgi:hypothetical protein
MYLLFFFLLLFYVNLLLKWFWVGVVSFVGGFGELGIEGSAFEDCGMTVEWILRGMYVVFCLRCMRFL